jgi:hypothetical protein
MRRRGNQTGKGKNQKNTDGTTIPNHNHTNHHTITPIITPIITNHHTNHIKEYKIQD